MRKELGSKVNQDAFQQMNGDAGSRVAKTEEKLAQVFILTVVLHSNSIAKKYKTIFCYVYNGLGFDTNSGAGNWSS